MRNDEDEIITDLRQRLHDLRVDQENIRLEGDAVELRLQTAVERARRARQPSPVSVITRDTTHFRIGTLDSIGRRIVVGNRVGTGRSTDQRATVTGITQGRTYFTTDSGISTWRAHRNIRHEQRR